MTCVEQSAALAVGLACFQAFSLLIYGYTERVNAPWLPFWRRYLSLWPLLLGIALSARYSVPWSLVLAAPILLNWNVWTANRNRRNGRRPKPGLSLGAMLTAVQAGALKRESAACRT